MSGRSAIIEPGDGEMTVPPVLQPTLEIFSPLLIPSGATSGPMADTWMTGLDALSVGPQVELYRNFVTFSAGRWDVEIDASFNHTGTTNALRKSGVDLVDNVGNVAAIFNSYHFNSVIEKSRHIRLPFLFLQNGWFLRTRTGINIAGDITALDVNVYARRIF